ncbi:MAG: T9SS type A sorting domain-containing protein [Bacteroidota bacterium]
MKQILSLACVLCMMSFHVQAQRVLPKSSINTKSYTLESLQKEIGADALRQQATRSTESPRAGEKILTTGAVTISKIGEASNAYTFVASDNHQLSTLGNNVGFIYRQNINDCGGENGIYRYSISADGGQSWDLAEASSSTNGCFGYGPLNPDFERASRYPNFTFFQGADDAVNIAYVGPVLSTNNQGWNGHILGTAQDVAGGATVTQEIYQYQDGGQYLPYSLVERVPGEFWYVARSSIDGTVDGLTDGIVVNKGTFNSTSGVIDWSEVATLTPDFFLNFDGQARFTTPNIAFSPDGSTGYVGFLGDLVGGQDTVYSPIFIETTDGGNTWEDPYEFDMGAFPELTDSLQSALFIDDASGDTLPAGTGKATTGFQTDLVVDKDGNPHMLAVVGNAGANPLLAGGDGLAGYAISSGIIIYAYDFTRDNLGEWNMLYLGNQSAFRGEFGDPNNADDAALLESVDPWMQISRSEDGSVIFYSWTDTDTTLSGSTDNIAPNLIGRAFDLNSYKVSPYTNWTQGDPTWDGFVLMPKVSPTAITTNDGYTVPTVFMDLDGNSALTPVSFWYVSDVNYASADFTEDPGFFYNCAQNPFVNSVTVNEPSCGAADGSIVVSSSGGLGTFSYAWDANAGLATTSTVSDLAAGVYTVFLEDSVGCNESITVTLANQGAPTISIEAANISNITCAGELDGSAAAGVTGGTAPFAYEWSNGETDSIAIALPAGIAELKVTDANNCATFATAIIVEPDTISTSAQLTSVTCAGFEDGSINLSTGGGTGELSYSWSTGAITPDLDSLAGGTYTVTVTDENNCTAIDSFTVVEPVALAANVSSTPNANENEPFTGTATITADAGTGTSPYTYLWNDGTAQSFNFGLCGGSYSATITDANGCTVTDTVIVEGIACVTTSLEDELAAGVSSWEVFPNPASASINLAISLEQVESLQLSLIDLQGRILRAERADNVRVYTESWNLENLAPGMYFIRIKTDRGAASRTLIVN